ncbi:hypothetical protein PHYPSEUDO_013182 [Phytophthora pseudosyringae]|uniref:HAT C-terminal dimerisation domain-containing protein n=1 Tax=Phytophthora pseudosyringae TaxID=221518 RepID=A0A8T1W7B9_9STRA|nr:hypothetical protein PHYPSEUDO_013182 [Phytophthora pseudosyringae]
MQYLLHPSVKHPGGPMDEIVYAVAVHQNIRGDELSHHVAKVRNVVIRRIKDKMIVVANENQTRSTDGLTQSEEVATNTQTMPTNVFSADIMRAFTIQQHRPPINTHSVLQARIDDEIDSWFADRGGLETRSGTSTLESVLEYWKRQHESNNYRYLPTVARMIFAVPSSSAQIERDFGKNGQFVSSLRTSTSAQNIDMASFLSRNRQFIDVCQCPKLATSDIKSNIPTNVTDDLTTRTDERIEWGVMSLECLSASLSDIE